MSDARTNKRSGEESSKETSEESSKETSDKRNTKDAKAVIQNLIQTFQLAIFQLMEHIDESTSSSSSSSQTSISPTSSSSSLSSSSLTRDHFWLVTARSLMNRKELCDKDCGTDIHFHDCEDWFEPEERKTLERFWKKITKKSNDPNEFVDKLVAFAKANAAKIVQLMKENQAAAQTFLESIVDNKDDMVDLLQQILDVKEEATKSFPFICSTISMIIEYQNKDVNEQFDETALFEMFLELFIDDYCEDESDSEESESEEDGEASEDEDPEKEDEPAQGE